MNRNVLPTSPVGVEYSLTPLAQTLQQPFVALYEWALEYGPALEKAQKVYDLAHPDEADEPEPVRN